MVINIEEKCEKCNDPTKRTVGFWDGETSHIKKNNVR